MARKTEQQHRRLTTLAQVDRVLRALEATWPPGHSPEGFRRHHAISLRSGGEADVLALHMWVTGQPVSLVLGYGTFSRSPEDVVRWVNEQL